MIPTILIVDDISKNIQVVGNILKDNGYNINFALTGETALEHIKQNDYDLILLDIMLPGLNGIEVCRILKSDSKLKDIPVIFLTAKTDLESISEGFQAGGVDYVTKPFMKDELLARVKTHIEINTQRKELIELNNTKNKFFSIIAHDLKNSLGGLMSYTKFLATDINQSDPGTIKKIANNTSKLAKNTYDFLENLLTWSRSQMGHISFTPQYNDLFSAVEDELRIISVSAKQKNISIQNEIINDTIIFCDLNMISTVLRNLLTNAVKFTNEGGTIKITSRFTEENVKNEKTGETDLIKFIEVSVIDNGIGMQPRVSDKLFKEESTYSSAGTNKEIGTGLGLLLCREFVNKHQGKIRVESSVNVGSTFYFSIPC